MTQPDNISLPRATVDAVREALRALVHQIEINDFTDSLGHKAKMLKAFIDAKGTLNGL